MAMKMKMPVLICMLMAKVCEGNKRHTNTTDKGGRGVSGAGRHKAGGGTRRQGALGSRSWDLDAQQYLLFLC